MDMTSPPYRKRYYQTITSGRQESSDKSTNRPEYEKGGIFNTNKDAISVKQLKPFLNSLVILLKYYCNSLYRPLHTTKIKTIKICKSLNFDCIERS